MLCFDLAGPVAQLLRVFTPTPPPTHHYRPPPTRCVLVPSVYVPSDSPTPVGAFVAALAVPLGIILIAVGIYITYERTLFFKVRRRRRQLFGGGVGFPHTLPQ
jgi:hypothetical protein